MKISDHIYGSFVVEPVLAELIGSKPLQRLKGINQYGTYILVDKSLTTTRFEHSVGVMLLLRKLGASLKEQIAGLLHDICHTAFSHVGDYAFGRQDKHDFHEQFFEQIIVRSEIPSILERHGYDYKDLLDDSAFSLLEKSLPDLCADRIDYTLRDGLIIKHFDIAFAKSVVDSIIVKDDEMLIGDRAIAKQLAFAYIDINMKFWALPFQVFSYQALGDAIRIAIEKGLMSKEDMFLTDDVVFSKLTGSKDKEILSKLKLIDKDACFVSDENDYDIISTVKLRFIDPKLPSEGFRRLSEVDALFREKLGINEKFNIHNRFFKIRDGFR